MAGEEDGTGLRRRTDKDSSLRDRVDEVRRKMKASEAAQERRAGLLAVARPVLLCLVAGGLLYLLYMYMGKGSNPGAEPDVDDVVEEIIAEL